MSKIAEKRIKELGYSKDPFNRPEFTANDIFDACIECYDQAMQDFLEKANRYFIEIANKAQIVLPKLFFDDFKNYMQNEM